MKSNQQEYYYFWVKYRTTHAWGYDSWEYKELTGPKKYSKNKLIKMFKEDMDSDNSWSEHYRGTQVTQIDLPPIEILKQQIQCKTIVIKSYKDSVKRYKELLNTVEKKPAKKAETTSKELDKALKVLLK